MDYGMPNTGGNVKSVSFYVGCLQMLQKRGIGYVAKLWLKLLRHESALIMCGH